jgi:hypothetical protein
MTKELAANSAQSIEEHNQQEYDPEWFCPGCLRWVTDDTCSCATRQSFGINKTKQGVLYVNRRGRK